MTTTKYQVRMEGARETIEAENLEDAIGQAREWAAEGDWDTSGGTIWVHAALYVLDNEGEIIEDTHESISVTIDPPEPACAAGLEHDWQSPYELVGGIKENPGVYGHGGGVTIQEVCIHCGCGKLTDTWAQDSETGRQGLESVLYEQGKYDVPASTWEIQTRTGNGPWANDTVGAENDFASEADALEAIEELKQLEDDSWRVGEYRVARK